MVHCFSAMVKVLGVMYNNVGSRHTSKHPLCVKASKVRTVLSLDLPGPYFGRTTLGDGLLSLDQL